MLPLWFLFGLGSACFSAAMMLGQERFKLNGYAIAFWNKAACACVMLPFIVMQGVPHQPMFYLLLGAGAAMYAVSDVIFFAGITKSSAGAVSRLLPASVIPSFLLWFAVSPALLVKYLHAPAVSLLILLTLCLSAALAMRLKKCAVSMQALRSIWFVLFAATVGPILGKWTTLYSDAGQGLCAYVFFQAVMMLAIWLVWFAVKRPVPASLFFSRHTLKGGLLIGLMSVGAVFLNVAAYYHVDNPAYIPAVKFLDSALILIVYRLTRQKKGGDIAAGIGIVACAAALVVLKAQIH